MACEGTRFTEKKRLESMKYAREKNLPELKYHILPRTRGFTMIMQGAKGKSTSAKKSLFNSFVVL
jgi:lysophosphatidic acid acyltransferase/lysophosphatidylinositol acyltransferase